MNNPLGSIPVEEATVEQVGSLSTVVARAFHPVNAFIQRVFPDTPAVRKWFCEIFEEEINDPTCHLLTAIDNNAISPDIRNVGILCMRRLNADYRGGGMFNRCEWTPDHDVKIFQPALAAEIRYREQAFLGTGRDHYIIELFGVDHAYKGSGIGKRLLSKACDIADKENVDMFVQANAFARDFYTKVGFEVQGTEVLPGDVPYVEHMLVRWNGRAKQE